MRFTMLRNGTHVPKSASQLRNTLPNGAFPAKWRISCFGGSQPLSQLRNGGSCAAKWHSCAKSCFAAVKIFAAMKRPLGTRVPFCRPVHPFRSYEMAAKPPCLEDPPFHSRDAIWKGVSQLRNHPLAHECHFVAPYTLFATVKWL